MRVCIRLSWVAGLLLAGVAASSLAESQTPPDRVQVDAARPQPADNLPSGLIDSRPILHYFGDLEPLDTVRSLLGELNQPDTCGKGAQLRATEACALIFYRLDERFTPDRLRPPLIIKAIYRVTQPEDLARTVIVAPDRSGELKRLADEDLYEPLRDIRANICLLDKRMPDTCSATGSKGVLYHVFGVLGREENRREGILPEQSAARHFAINVKGRDAEGDKVRQIQDLCNQSTYSGVKLLTC